MKKDPKELESAEAPELQTCTSISSPNSTNEKCFAKDEATIHFEVEKPAMPAPAKQLTLDTSTPAPGPTKDSFPKFQRGQSTELMLPPVATEKSFWPVVVLVFAVAAGGYYRYQKQLGANRGPASLIMEPAPDTILNAPMPAPERYTIPKSSEQSAVPEDAAVYVLKSDGDDFQVLVNGKDMPVIGGKISLPLNEKFDLRFVRRGHQEIQLMTGLTKAERKEVVLRFQKK